LTDVKLIDFGSSYFYDEKSVQFQANTPEYCAPEILDYLENPRDYAQQYGGNVF
jgi:serine/threonine protein kinase